MNTGLYCSPLSAICLVSRKLPYPAGFRETSLRCCRVPMESLGITSESLRFCRVEILRAPAGYHVKSLGFWWFPLLFSHELIATMQSVVTGQAPVTLERKITSGENQIENMR